MLIKNITNKYAWNHVLTKLVEFDVICVVNTQPVYSTCDKWDIVVYNHKEKIPVPDGAYHQVCDWQIPGLGIQQNWLDTNCERFLLNTNGGDQFYTYLVRIDKIR